MVKEELNPYAVKSPSPEPPVLVAPVPFPARYLLVSLVVMLPWPLFGILACLALSLFEKPSESMLMFGGVTLVFLLPLALITNEQWVYELFIGILWLVVLLAPLWFSRKIVHPRFNMAIIFVLQSLISAVQAGLGFLFILGKGV